MLPAYSVIIPHYNHAAFIRKRLDSILQQTIPPDEIIVLDDASTDNSLEIIRSYHDERIRLYVNEQNSGSTFVQWKKGIALARNEIVWIAESDDFCAHNMAAQMLPFFLNDEISFVFSDSTVIDQNDNIMVQSLAMKEMLFGREMESPKEWKGFEFVTSFMLAQNAVPNASSVFFRKSLVTSMDDAWQKYKVVGDWLFWMELAKQAKVVFIPQCLNFFRKHAQTVRQSRLRIFNKEKLQIYLHLSKKKEFQAQSSFLKSRVFNYWLVFLHPRHGWTFNKEIWKLTPDVLRNDRQLWMKLFNRLFEWLTFSNTRKHV